MLTVEPIIFPYLSEESVHFIKASSRNSALEMMVKEAPHGILVGKEEQFLAAIFSREELVSTGIGLSCAIPHAKLPEFDDFFLNIGIIQGAGIEWKSIDQVPVRLIFMIGGPINEPNRYLKILSAITEAIRSDEFRSRLLSCHSAKEVLKLFERI
jgi:PTS system nitrogen regulatory IIA component